MTGPAVAIVADDLIWAERLRGLVVAGGARATSCRTLTELEAALPAVEAVVVDLSARSFDPQVAIGRAADLELRVLAVGPHDAGELRDRARASGADRVLAYRALAEAGPTAIGRWLGDASAASAATRDGDVGGG